MPKMPSMHSGRGRTPSSKLRHGEAAGNVGLLTAVLVAVSLIMFTLSAREGEGGFFGGVRGVVQTITSPVKVGGGYLVTPITGVGNIFRNLTADEQTLSELKEENEQLRARNVELEEADQTARRLEELLELRNTYSLQSVAARVIAGSSDSWVASVTIDRGGGSGITVGMPVTNAVGAVGQVIKCAGTTATVRLLTDEGSSVAVMVQSSRAQGMAVGSPDGTLRLTLIRTDQEVSVGDVVVTSGLGGVFPKGLPVGKVTVVEKNPGSTYYDIVVEPFFRPKSLEEVLVITSLTEEQEATSEDIEDADRPDLEAASGRAVGEAAGEETAGEEASGEQGAADGVEGELGSEDAYGDVASEGEADGGVTGDASGEGPVRTGNRQQGVTGTATGTQGYEGTGAYGMQDGAWGGVDDAG